MVAGSTESAGKSWLEENKFKNGVVVLQSGLQYRVIKSGPAGGKSPSHSTPCLCHYRGRLIDGTEFDNTYKRGKPTTFKPSEVFEGWSEAMLLMKEGDKWELFIPPELARGAPQRGAVLIFELEIIKVNPKKSEL